MGRRILLIGSGAREHVIAETLLRSRHEVEIFVVGSNMNPGLRPLCADYVVGNICDTAFVGDFAARVKPDFAVVGPEAPIEAGVVDYLAGMGVKSCSPLQTVGRLESSKGFTRDLLRKYEIPGNPKFRVFENEEGLEEFFAELGGEFVVKADGLKGGKGVKLSGEHLNGVAEGVAYAKECLADDGRVVVEEKFVGQEFSLMSFCDGSNTVEMPCVQDHKRAYDGDKGPNTGGMGTYSDANGLLPFLSESDVAEAAEITRMVAAALKEETGVEFKGIMYGGFIAVRDGVRLIEYNARFGDPEAMNVLTLLKTDLVDIFEAMIAGELDKLKVEFEAKATVCKYVVPEGYPDAPVKGVAIEISDVPSGVKVYYASVDAREDGLYLGGSRAVAMVGIADNLEEASKIADAGVQCVKGPVFYRRDIGTAALIDARVAMMRQIRQ